MEQPNDAMSTEQLAQELQAYGGAGTLILMLAEHNDRALVQAMVSPKNQPDGVEQRWYFGPIMEFDSIQEGDGAAAQFSAVLKPLLLYVVKAEADKDVLSAIVTEDVGVGTALMVVQVSALELTALVRRIQEVDPKMEWILDHIGDGEARSEPAEGSTDGEFKFPDGVAIN